MGKFLPNSGLCDTYDIYLISIAKTEFEGTNTGYFSFISRMKDEYFKAFNIKDDFTGLKAVEDFKQFHQFIEDFHKDLINKNGK